MQILKHQIYLDHNATSNVDEEVIAFMRECLQEPMNPSSIHNYGRKAKFIIEEARVNVLKLLGIEKPNQNYALIFTASGTEANSTVIKSYANENCDIFISAIEHVSIFEYKNYLSNVNIIKVDKHGVLDLEHLEFLLATSTKPEKLVCVMLANNETGVIQPIADIANIAHKFGALLHTDGVAAVGKIGINLEELQTDFFSISGHKFGAIMGVGALIIKNHARLTPLLIGGGQEKGMRSGTENVLAISTIGVAAQNTQKSLNIYNSHMITLRNMLETRLLSNFPDITIAGYHAERIPNTSLIMKKGLDAAFGLIAFDLKGISVSSGSACSSGKIGKSHVLEAMHVDSEYSKSAIRVSIGRKQDQKDIEHFIQVYGEIYG